MQPPLYTHLTKQNASLPLVSAFCVVWSGLVSLGQLIVLSFGFGFFKGNLFLGVVFGLLLSYSPYTLFENNTVAL